MKFYPHPTYQRRGNINCAYARLISRFEIEEIGDE